MTADERAAVKEYMRERRAASRRRAAASPEEGEREVLAKIAGMPEPDRSKGQRIHAIVRANAPSLVCRTWYGMPAYANSEGDVVCFFQDAAKFKTRYATLGFSDSANLDDGGFWPVGFAVHELNSAIEARIAALVKRAVG
ncbi:MAG TPA: hypothetical protein VGU43_04490 [Thermoplasmata archaeon]|nr:hypothetical protein [Thermoplasmata archaeon]